MAVAASSEPLLLMERLAHIRCVCVTLHAREGTPGITEMNATALSSRCICLHVSFCAGMPPCFMKLEFGEELDDRAALRCSVSDGFAYASLPLAPPSTSVAPEAARATPVPKARTTIFWGASGSNRWGTPVPCAPKLGPADLTLSAVSGRISDELRESRPRGRRTHTASLALRSHPSLD